MQLRFEGTFTAIVTPFLEDESIDDKALVRLLEAQIQGGVRGVVPCGTTGESPTLSGDEQGSLVRRVVELSRGRVNVVAGAGSNSTKSAIELAKAAERAGADAVMVVAPYYNKPTQEGLFRHFVAVAAAVSLPVMLYNIPGRTGVDVLPDTIARVLEASPNVRAIKEATGNVLRAQELHRRFGDRLAVLSGDDALTLPMMAVGAKGVVSVTSNALPLAVSKLTTAALTGDQASALRMHLRLLPIHELMFLEANPGPVKAALAALGVCGETVRGPLAPVSDGTKRAVNAAIEALRSTESL